MVFPKKLLIVSLVVIVAGLLIYFLGFRTGLLFKGKDPVEAEAEEAIRPAEAPLPVQVASVIEGDLVILLQSPGEAVTDRKTVLKAEVSGRIKNLNVEEGRSVRKGDLLVELDDREYRLELEKSEASRLRVLSELLLEKQFSGTAGLEDESQAQKIEKARKEYEAISQQYHQGLLSEEEFERAFLTYEKVLIESGSKKDEIMAATKGLTQQEIAVKKAQLNLEKTRILAPFSGTITEIHVSEQQQVSASTELFTLVNTSRVRVQAKVLESEIGKMRVGREVDLSFSAYPGEVFKGRVEVVSPLMNEEDKTCKVLISLINPAKEIKPGMFAAVSIEADIYRGRLLVPQSAIIVRSGRKIVFVVEEGKAKRRYILTGMENEDYAEVLESDDLESVLKEGDLVIVEGHFNLAQDAPVTVQK
jgi:RND family efflux transporter MFP subunit